MPSTETKPLLLPRESPYEKRKRVIATTCILTLHTLHSVAFWTMFLQLWSFLNTLKKSFNYMQDEMPSIVVLLFQAVSYLLLPTVGGILGDVTLGRYKAIFIGAVSELIGTTFFLIIAGVQKWGTISPPVSFGLTIGALVFIGLGMGFIMPNVVAFGAQQVDTGNFGHVQSFMIWYTWCLNLGQLIAYLPMAYILLDDRNKYDGYLIAAGIQVFAMALSIAVFIFGKPKYRMMEPEGKKTLSQMAATVKERLCCQKSYEVHFGGINYDKKVATLILKQVILLTVLFSLLISYEGVFFQQTTSYLDQAKMLRSPQELPKGMMYVFNPLAMLVAVPILSRLNYYDDTNPRYFIRLAIGVTFGFFSALMAGLVQITADQALDANNVNTTDMSIWVQVPQFAFVGIGEAFTDVAGYEIAYAESPPGIEGMMVGMFASCFGAGSLIGSVLYYFLQQDSKHGVEWVYFTFAILTIAMVPLIIAFSRSYKVGKYRNYRQQTIIQDSRAGVFSEDRNVHHTSLDDSDDDSIFSGTDRDIFSDSDLSSRI